MKFFYEKSETWIDSEKLYEVLPDSPEDWLDGFNTFSIYQILPQLIQLWGLNTQTDVQSKKNFAQLSGK